MSGLLLIGGLGVPELLLILVIVIVVFGAGKLPQIGDALGRGIRNFKKSSSGNDEIDVTPKQRQSLPPRENVSGVVEAEEIKRTSE